MPRINYFVPCAIEGCGKTMLARGLCRMHYYRLLRTGTTDPKPAATPAERFWTFVDKDGPVHHAHGQCWVWTGGLFRRGYGAFHVDGKLVKAHRFSWEIHNGPIPDGLRACHHCDNASCVNPSHLFIGTDTDNASDRDAKGRTAKGESQHKAKLTADQVRAIRQRYVKDSASNNSVVLAMEFGVSHVTILRVVYGRCWKHVLL